MVDDPLMECLSAFAAHEYERAADLAVNLLQQRRFHWLCQIVIISLQRLGNDRAVEAGGWHSRISSSTPGKPSYCI